MSKFEPVKLVKKGAPDVEATTKAEYNKWVFGWGYKPAEDAKRAESPKGDK